MRVSEFVMSNELVSMTLAMVSESREVNTILKELFAPEGNELYVHPAARYLRYARRRTPNALPSRSLQFAARNDHTTCRKEAEIAPKLRLTPVTWHSFLIILTLHAMS